MKRKILSMMLSSMLVMSPLTAFAAEDENFTETVEVTENELEDAGEVVEETTTEEVVTEVSENTKVTDDILVDEPSEEITIEDASTPLTGPVKSEIEVTYNDDGTATVVDGSGEAFMGTYSYDDNGNLVLEITENELTDVYTLNIAYSSSSDTGFDIYTVTEDTDINELSDTSKDILNTAGVNSFTSGYDISAEITESGINISSITKTEGTETEIEKTTEKVFVLEADETDEVVITDEATPLAGGPKEDEAVEDVEIADEELIETTEEVAVENTTETDPSEPAHDEPTEDVKKEDIVVKVEDIAQVPEVIEIETPEKLD